MSIQTQHTDVQTQKITGAGGVRLNTICYGDSANVPLVLVHGYPDSATMWRPMAEILAREFYVVTYDVRGAGDSDVPAKKSDYLIEVLAQDLAAVVDALIPGRAFHLAAHDWGSIQSWESVVSDRLRGRIASYTTVSGPSLDHVAAWMKRSLTNLSPSAKKRVINQLVSSWYIAFFQLPVLAPALWKAGFGKLWTKYLESREGVADPELSPTQTQDGVHGVELYRANFIDRMFNANPRPAHCPVQLIVPTKDNYVGAQLFEDLHLWVDELYRRDINAGHWVSLSRPELLAGMIAEFVRGIESGNMPQALQRSRVQARRMHLPLVRQLAVVTGAGSGIGRATAIRLAKEGADILAVDINATAAERTAELVRGEGSRAWSRVVDVSSAEAMESLANYVATELGGADIVVNNAGIGMAGGVLQTSLSDWQAIMGVNLWGVIHGSRLFAQQMVEGKRHGHIVNVASASAFAPSKSMPAYATTKSAVHMLTECLRAEMADHDIGVTSVCPGFVATGIATSTRYAGLSEAEQAEKRRKADALYKRRNYSVDDVADAVFKAIRSNRPLALVGAEARGIRLINRFAPTVSRLMARIELTP